MTGPADFATSDANGSLNVILRNEAGAYAPGGGGGGGDASAANQTLEIAVLGAAADAAVTTNTTGTISAKLRGVVAHLVSILAKQPALGTAGTASTDVITVQGIASGTAQAVSGTVTANAGTGTLAVSGPVTDAQIRATALPVSGTVTANAGTGTLAVSAASLPLPSGAATAAKQPALGTAGSAATDVITVQGIASGTAQPASQSGTWTVQPGNTANTTAWKVDGSAVTQPVSGTVSITPPAYTAPAVGELQGVTAATQLPTVTCKMVQIKAARANTGNVYIGITGVTKVDATTDTTTGLQLGPGDSTGWIPVDNLNRLYRICDNTTDAATYLAMN